MNEWLVFFPFFILMSPPWTVGASNFGKASEPPASNIGSPAAFRSMARPSKGQCLTLGTLKWKIHTAPILQTACVILKVFMYIKLRTMEIIQIC